MGLCGFLSRSHALFGVYTLACAQSRARYFDSDILHKFGDGSRMKEIDGMLFSALHHESAR